MPVDVIESPFVHINLPIGTTYYYAVTYIYMDLESEASDEIQATVGAPQQPVNLNASLVGTNVELNWDIIPEANAYTLYWANEPGVTRKDGISVSNVTSPYYHTRLSGQPYYYTVTAVNGFGESLESEEVNEYPPLPPPTPAGLRATLILDSVDFDQTASLVWETLPGVDSYSVYGCRNHSLGGYEPNCTISITEDMGCWGNWVLIGSPKESEFLTSAITVHSFGQYHYKYYVQSHGKYGTSPPSNVAGVCTLPAIE